MSGRRLLDAVAVFKASRAIAAKHIALRQNQINDYNKTSSLTKAVRSQTDRVTLTAKAALTLAERLNGSIQENVAQTPRSGQDNWNQGKEGNVNSAGTQNGPSDTPAQDEVVQSKIVGRVSSHRIGREHQKKDDIQDQPPRVQVVEPIISQDEKPPLSFQKTVSDSQDPNPGELPEEAYNGIFQSRRVSKMLRGQPNALNPSKGLELPQVITMPIKDTQVGNGNGKGEVTRVKNTTEISSLTGNSELNPSGNRDDVHQLAADIRKDRESNEGDVSSNLSTNSEHASQDKIFEMRESKVPSSRIGRIWQYGGLATSMAFGAVGESFRRATGVGGESGSLVLSEANMERLVAKLSRMRGAALKLGQMMSFQDSKMLPKPINDVLQRVQDSADYMPPSQRNRVLASNLGPDWRSLFSTFDESPIAAASIGQVHRATLASTSQSVAVKVQYPGVASSIDSDLSNLAILLTASRLLPKGLYLDKTIDNARVELAWECDYVREAEMGQRFRDLLADQADIYHVPAIIQEASGPQVLTAEYVEGTGVTKGQHFTQEQKDWIGSNILRLCLREITEFKFMQTDPNWTNFLFNSKTNKIELLDFGASRDFPDKFILPYMRTLLAASRGDRQQVRNLSIELGYLTGHESKAMVDAHVNSVLTLAEPFAETAPEVYDFQDQTITDRVRGFIPVMLRERLSPPPEETYSIHRKLSGAFLLCARLGSRVRCREMFEHAMKTAGIL